MRRLLSPEDIEKYKHEERLDGATEIAHYLGISESQYYVRLQKDMLESGILFRRTGYGSSGRRKVRTKYFTYKRLIFSWLIKRGGVL